MTRSWWIAGALTLALGSSSRGVSPQVWYIASAQEVEKGDVEGLSVGDDGVLTLAPTLEDLGETEEMFVWSLAEDQQGRIFAGTGNQGRLFVKEGAEAPRLFFDCPQTQLQSVAVDAQGNIYTGTAPDGIIYKITSDGRGTVFCHTGETYVWDLKFNREGFLYAATGTRGIVLKIDRDGKIVNKVLDSPDVHVMNLVPDGHNGFYAGTDGNGLIYHVNAQDEPRLLFAAQEREIHTMALGPDGRLYAGAVAGRRESSSSSSSSEREPGGVIYRLEPSGAATRLWVAPYPLILSLAAYDSTRMLVGVGPRGVLYWLSTEGRVQRVADTGESQPMSLLRRKTGAILIGMGNSGKVKQIGQNSALRGVFTSDARDGELVCQWGRLEARADVPNGAQLSIETRTGNRKDPFQDWSLWQPLSGAEKDMVQSPPGQYIQVRATLSRTAVAPSPTLYSIGITGQQVNVRPEIAGIRISPYRTTTTPRGEQQGEESGERPPPSSAARAAAKRTIMVIRWGASDPNDDNLAFDLFYRRVGETAWKVLDQDVTRNLYLWDTEGAPEGLTVVKVVASDRPSNPWTTAMTAERTSDPFQIDYTGPVITGLAATVRADGAVIIRGTGSDASGTIREGTYSIDSGEWLVFFPEDGIFDSPQESLNFVSEVLDPGEHTIVVKLTDAAENVGTASVVVNVPKR